MLALSWILIGGILILLQRGRTIPTVFLDELVYGRPAQNLGYGEGLTFQGFDPSVRSLYPYLIAPAYALLRGPEAHQLALAINALVMTSAIFPAYLLARRVASFPWALASAAVAVLTPSIVWAGMLMSEALAYPCAALALLLTVRAVREPGTGTALLAATGGIIATAVRVQLVVLLVVLVVAILVDVALGGRAGIPQHLRPRLPALALFAFGGLGAAALVARGHGDMLLGHQACDLRLGASVQSLLGKAVEYVGVVFVASVGLPLLAWLALAFERPAWRDREVRALLAVGGATVGLLIFQAAFFAVTVSPQLQERYVFYATPVLAALLPVAASGARARVVAVVGMAVVVYFVALFPGFADVRIRTGGLFAQIASDQNLLFAIAAAGLAAVLLLAQRGPGKWGPATVIAPAIVFGLLLVTVRQADANRDSASRSAMFPQPTDWIDDAAGGPVGLVMMPGSDPIALFTLQVTNRWADRTFRLGIRNAYGAGELCRLVLDGERRLQIADRCRRGLPAHLLFIQGRHPMRVQGAEPLRREKGLTLYRIDPRRPPRLLGLPRDISAEPPPTPAPRPGGCIT